MLRFNSFIKKHGFTRDKKFIYGWIDEIFVSVNWKNRAGSLNIYLCPSEKAAIHQEKLAQALLLLQACDAKKYGLLHNATKSISISAGMVSVAFYPKRKGFDNVDAFISDFFPRLRELGIEDGSCCAKCGEALDGDTTVVLADDLIVPVHNECISDMEKTALEKNLEFKPGSVFTGTIGAFLGAVVGAIPWAIVYASGYFASIIGFLIAIFVNFGYGLFRGRNSKARTVVVLTMVIVGVLLGQVAGHSAILLEDYYGHSEVSAPEYLIDIAKRLVTDQTTTLTEEYEILYKTLSEEEIASGDFYSLEEFIEIYYDVEYDEDLQDIRTMILKDCFVGLLFGVLGSIGVLRKSMDESKGHHVRELKRIEA